ncbi:MAG: apolipoprotein N-acyltransferase [Burkholderiales bacterium]|nr:MAG: apolipoprotein N-acyltransferase [Burkholderiales bacterium]
MTRPSRRAEPSAFASRAGARSRAAAALAALGLGLVHAASFSPLEHWTLALAALAGLFGLLRIVHARGASPLAQAGLTLLFGLGWFAAGLAWLYISMHRYGGMPAPMAVAAVVLFAAYLSLYPALAVGVAARWGAARSPLARALGLAGAWTVGELARGWAFTGFPWLAVGYAQLDGPLDRLAPVLGVHGVGAAAALVAALLAALIPGAGAALGRTGLPAAAVAVALVVGPLAVPRDAWTRAHGAPLSVRLVQGNVEQDMKFRPDRTLAAMRDYAQRFVEGGATLTILPETAWTAPWDRTPAPIAQAMLEHVARGHALALGVPTLVQPTGPGDGVRIANSVLMMRPGVPVDPSDSGQRYDKHHLVPFGEFVPWGFRWFVDLMTIPLGDFSRGAAVQPAFTVGDQRIAFNICYEDLFGEEIRLALPGEGGATVLANVSNIAWFGRSHALPQHLAIARMRTLETGRPMLRATNTGVTAAIDASGRVIAALEPNTAGVLDARVQGTTGLTPFARRGHAPVLALSLAAIALAIVAARAGRAGRSR